MVIVFNSMLALDTYLLFYNRLILLDSVFKELFESVPSGPMRLIVVSFRFLFGMKSYFCIIFDDTFSTAGYVAKQGDQRRLRPNNKRNETTIKRMGPEVTDSNSPLNTLSIRSNRF